MESDSPLLSKHYERESLAAAIKGLSFDEHLHRKNTSGQRDPADEFAAWHERFQHEIRSEFEGLSEEELFAEFNERGSKTLIKSLKTALKSNQIERPGHPIHRE